MKFRALVGSACALVVWRIGSAQAQSVQVQSAPPAVVALDYQAPADCPDAATFRAQVLGRTQRLTFTSADTSADVRWSVSVNETAAGSRGSLRVSGVKPGNLERNVTASSCEQVVNALALVGALSIDPEASLTARAEPAAAAPSSAARPTPTPATTPPEAAREPPGPTRKTRLSVGLTLTGRSGLAPQLAWAPRPFLGAAFRSPSGYTWGVSLSASQVHGSASTHVGRAAFTWRLARVEAFPVRLSLGSLRFEPSLFVEGGQLLAHGEAVAPAAEVRRPALFAGALGRLSLVAVDRLVLQVEGGALAPLLRDRFYLYENTTIFEVSRVTGFLAAGVGVEFL